MKVVVICFVLYQQRESGFMDGFAGKRFLCGHG